MNIRIRKTTLYYFLIGFVLFAILVWFLISSGVMNSVPQSTNLWAIFATGLFTGGLTCLAVQGGLLAATIAQREQGKLEHKVKETNNAIPILAFLFAKLIAYTLLGLLLGWFGSLFQLSIAAQIIMQTLVVVFMLGTALNILNVHPIFRYFVIQPPKFLTRVVRKQSKSSSLFSPALLGAFTVFIPCGTTQAMMALAIGSGSPLLGAMILFAFVLGTSPLFFILGYFAMKLGDSLHKKFMRAAAIVLILLAVFNLTNVLALSGLSWSFGNPTAVNNAEAKTYVTIDIKSHGYNPKVVTVKSGSEVTFTIKNEDAFSCAAAFTIPFFNFQKIVEPGDATVITLKMPENPMQIPFMCSMGMYRGVINVI